MGIFEIFVIDDEVRHMINKRTSTFILRQRARELGMRTLREDGVRKVLAGPDFCRRSHLHHCRAT
jgi:general secretion pathway protein E/type IV pilus assembly protein PilB